MEKDMVIISTEEYKKLILIAERKAQLDKQKEDEEIKQQELQKQQEKQEEVLIKDYVEEAIKEREYFTEYVIELEDYQLKRDKMLEDCTPRAIVEFLIGKGIYDIGKIESLLKKIVDLIKEENKKAKDGK